MVRHLDRYPKDGVARALDNVLSMDTRTGNNVHAAEIITNVLAKHSIRLEEEYLDGKDATMSTDVALAATEGMGWTVNELEGSAHLGEESVDGIEIGMDTQQEQQQQRKKQVEREEEWRTEQQQKLDALPTMIVSDVTQVILYLSF